jgi:sugar phosphate isomerase/epimerase
MTARIGFDHYTLAARLQSAEECLKFAWEHSFDGVQLLEPRSIDPDYQPERLRAVRQMADALGLYLEVGLPSPNPVRQSRERGRAVSPREWAHELERPIEALAVLGCSHARVYVGDRHDRFRADAPWTEQIDATAQVIAFLTPRLRDMGIRLAIETHQDLTVDELLRLLDRLDQDVVGVTLDTGNLVMRLDEPVAAAQKLAPYVLGTHVKDAVLAFTERGLCWQARPIGSGILPMPDILAALVRANLGITLSIELHPRTYDLPIYDRSWLVHFPDLRPADLAAVVRLAADCERRYAEGSLARPETIEQVPWASRDLDWLARSLGYLRSVVPTLIDSACEPGAIHAPSPAKREATAR